MLVGVFKSLHYRGLAVCEIWRAAERPKTDQFSWYMKIGVKESLHYRGLARDGEHGGAAIYVLSFFSFDKRFPWRTVGNMIRYLKF